MLKTAKVDKKEVFDAVRNVTQSCDVCKRLKKSPLRPVVGFPLASSFNDCLAVDLKQIGDNLYILHIIDHMTRYSQGCLIRSKKKGVIVKGLMTHWVQPFGPPRKILSDNGGEFVNSEIVDFAEKFNVDLLTTAAESAWSNGLVEKHNGVLNNTLQKIIADTNCCVEIALCWAIAAKNCLLNVFGFSPNTLVFGRNPSFPSVITNRPPANNPVTISKYLTDILNALHSGRERCLQQEASEKLSRALRRKTRTYSDNVFCLGDMVYYYRDSSSFWHGPAKIIGRDQKQFLLKQGGVYVRVHPCKLQRISNDSADLTGPQQAQSPEQKSKENDPDPIRPMDSDSDSSDPDQSTSQPTVSEPEGSTTDQIVVSTKDLPPNGSSIHFKNPLDSDWRSCQVISRGGKSKGGNWHYLNIKEGSQEKCISFKDASWKDSTQEVLVIESCHDDKIKFNAAKVEELEKWKAMQVYKDQSGSANTFYSLGADKEI